MKDCGKSSGTAHREPIPITLVVAAKDFTDRVVQRPRVRAAVGEQNNQTCMTPEQIVQMQRGRRAPGGNWQRALGATGALHHHHMVGPS